MGAKDNRFHLEVIGALATNDVVSIFFPYAMRSWIIDMRQTLLSPPVILVDGMVASPQARLESFRRIRPEMPNPAELTVIPWIGHVRQLEETGVLQAVYTRCREVAGSALDAQIDRCYQELIEAETNVKRQIILGVGMQPLWRRALG
jgi:hypothetical protein